jgi:hypothetical protein
MYCVKSPFTPLESPAIYGGDDMDKISTPYRKGGVKAPSFLTGFTLIVIPGLTRNPVFSIWIPAPRLRGDKFTPYLIRGGNDGFGTYVKKR